MQIRDKTVVVTGGANGIGRAMAQRFLREGARGVVIADLNATQVSAAAAQLGCLGVRCDVAQESDIQMLVKVSESALGPIDLFCSNAGIALADPDSNNAASSFNSDFERCWKIHVMAHVYAARALLPGMIARHQGYFLNTVSAAGLLTQLGSATYSATKHGAIGFAEHLAITHRGHGIKVSVLCPQAVRTAMLGEELEKGAAAVDGVITPEEVAESVIRGLGAESFLILPHPMVLEYMRRKSTDYERWIAGMARLHGKQFDSRAGG